ncbi:MAG: AmmeMemoRadiSam system protein B [bacterium]
MSLAFSAIVPHPPIIIPEIGKENIKRIKKTAEAYASLAKKFKESEATTIIIISPHGPIQNDAFSINLNPEFHCNFENFGDFGVKKTWSGDVILAHKIKESMESEINLHLISMPELDHGTSIPLCMLTDNLPEIKIIPIYYSNLNNAEHFNFGKLLKKEIVKSKERIAVLASGDLSHKLTKDAPGGYSPKAKKFDKKIIECLTEGKAKEIIEIDEKLICEAGECGLKSIVTLLGVLDNVNYEPRLLSYEAPFGVGYLMMNFSL